MLSTVQLTVTITVDNILLTQPVLLTVLRYLLFSECKFVATQQHLIVYMVGNNKTGILLLFETCIVVIEYI